MPTSPAKVAPNPKETSKAGKAQQKTVLVEVKSERYEAKSSLFFIIFT